MCHCERYFQPDEKLQKMITMLVVILVINLIDATAAALLIGFNTSLMLFIQALLLFVSYQSLVYFYSAMFILLCLYNGFSMFIYVGIIIQQIILTGSSGISKTEQYEEFGVRLFTLIFCIFSIIFVFPIYKEQKAQLYSSSQSSESRNRNNDPESNYRPPISNNQVSSSNSTENNNSNNNRGYVPFGGRGIQVGS